MSLKKSQKFDSSYFRGKNCFGVNDKQNYLVFQPIIKYFKTFNKTLFTCISSWESKGLSNEVIKPPTTSNNILASKLLNTNDKTFLEFNGSCLKQDKFTFIFVSFTKNINFFSLSAVNIYIAYEITKNNPVSSYPTLENCLLGAFKLT